MVLFFRCRTADVTTNRREAAYEIGRLHICCTVINNGRGGDTQEIWEKAVSVM